MTANATFEIYLVWSEQTLIVRANETALEVLFRAGVPIDPGCQVGACGFCAADYI